MSKAREFADAFNQLIDNMKKEYIPEKSFSFPCPAEATAVADNVVNFKAKSPEGYFGFNFSVKLDDPDAFKARISTLCQDFEPEECARAVFAAHRLGSFTDAEKCSTIFRDALRNEEMLQKFENIVNEMVDTMALVGVADKFFETVPTIEEQTTSLETLIATAENTPNTNNPIERPAQEKDVR